MTESSTSKELAILSTRQRCEYIIETLGVDRSGDGTVIGADWELVESDGQELKCHLIRQRRLGGYVIYSLRVRNVLEGHGSNYRFNPQADILEQTTQMEDGRQTKAFGWDPAVINGLLRLESRYA